MRLIYRECVKTQRSEYMDLALEPVTDHEEEREMFQSESAKSYLSKVERLKNASTKAA